MNNHYRTFKYTKGKTTPDGGRIEVAHGCNGVFHADQPMKVFRDEKGKVAYAESYPVKEIGPCPNNGACATNNKSLSGFLHSFPVPA